MLAIRNHRASIVATLVAAIVAIGATSPDNAKQGPVKVKNEAPVLACLRCGTTCDLEPVCICASSTKKKPTVEYEVECEPFCMAGCSSAPWPFGRDKAAGCTACAEDTCDCPGRVRSRKLLRKTTHDEEICVIERRVAYLCGPCSGRPGGSCCDASRTGCRPRWWPKLVPWWP